MSLLVRDADALCVACGVGHTNHIRACHWPAVSAIPTTIERATLALQPLPSGSRGGGRLTLPPLLPVDSFRRTVVGGHGSEALALQRLHYIISFKKVRGTRRVLGG